MQVAGLIETENHEQSPRVLRYISRALARRLDGPFTTAAAAGVMWTAAQMRHGPKTDEEAPLGVRQWKGLASFSKVTKPEANSVRANISLSLVLLL